MDLVDKWPCLQLTGIREQDHGIGSQLSQPGPVFQNKGVGGKSSQEGRGLCLRQALAPSVGAEGRRCPRDTWARQWPVTKEHSGGKTRAKIWSGTWEPVPQALRSLGMSREKTFVCGPPAPVWQPWSLSITTDLWLLPEREAGSLSPQWLLLLLLQRPVGLHDALSLLCHDPLSGQ